MKEGVMPEDTDSTGDTSATEDDTQTPLNEGGKKALEAERKARRDAERKANELEARLAAIEDKDKSEVTRLTEQVTRLTQELATATVDRARLKVALDKGLTATQAKRLVGSDEDELAADADELLADLGLSKSAAGDTDVSDESDGKNTAGPASKPRVYLAPGNGTGSTSTDGEITDVAAIGARMFAR